MTTAIFNESWMLCAPEMIKGAATEFVICNSLFSSEVKAAVLILVMIQFVFCAFIIFDIMNFAYSLYMKHPASEGLSNMAISIISFAFQLLII